ncbi:hypothetical protein AAIH32_12070 [Pseudarthrobacter oxydans]|uniref:hypothetical protein n=1 Tax=Pseudarthrobacter oxydans TaxID=1671 RepID=UPI003D2799E9
MTVQKALLRSDTSLTLDSVMILSPSDPELRSLGAASQLNQRLSVREGSEVEVMGRLLSGVVQLRLDGRSVEQNVVEVLARLFPDAELVAEKPPTNALKDDRGRQGNLTRMRTRPDAALYFEHDAVLVEVSTASVPLSPRQLTPILGMLFVEDRLGDVNFRHSIVVVSTTGFTQAAEELAERLDSVELVAWQTASFEEDLYRAVLRLTHRNFRM